MNKVYLISTQNLKDSSIINNNVDDSLLHNAILEAQEIELQQILGTRLYKYIIGLVEDGTISLPINSEYKQLLDEYCTKVVVYAAMLRAIPYIHYKVMNKGVQTQNSENSSTTSISEMEFIMDKIKNDLEFFSTRLSTYLLANREKFPEYSFVKTIDEIAPEPQQYRSAMVMDDLYTNPCIRSYGFNWRTVNCL